MEIKLLKGLENIKFGDTYEQLVATLGEPSNIEHMESFYNDELTILLAEFDNEELSVYMEGSEQKRITDFEIDAPNAIMFGTSLVNKGINEIKTLMKTNGFTDFEMEKDGNEEVLSYLDGQVDFNFEDNELVSIIWSIARNIDFTPRW